MDLGVKRGRAGAHLVDCAICEVLLRDGGEGGIIRVECEARGQSADIAEECGSNCEEGNSRGIWEAESERGLASELLQGVQGSAHADVGEVGVRDSRA